MDPLEALVRRGLRFDEVPGRDDSPLEHPVPDEPVLERGKDVRSDIDLRSEATKTTVRVGVTTRAPWSGWRHGPFPRGARAW